MKPAVVVAAYNRPRSLGRLLASMQKAQYPAGVRLVISIDAGGRNEDAVRQVAERYVWEAGEKLVMVHDSHLGLMGNIFFCGELTQEYGSIILLEDDLYVSPMYYLYSSQALTNAEDDPRIAGISLNAIWFNGYTHLPFEPYLDDSDHYFMQVAWFQGQAYTKAQWQRFASWRRESNVRIMATDPMHEAFLTFPETDWFPMKTKYLVQSDRYYVFPRESMSSNFGDAGTHFSQATRFFQVPLQTRRHAFRWRSLDESTAVYDSFQEILPERLNRLSPRFQSFDYAVDLNGTKSHKNLAAEFVLTTRNCQRPLETFGLVMRPALANVVEAIPGQGISFCRTQDVAMGRLATWAARKRNYDYFQARHRMGRRQWLQFKLIRLLAKSGCSNASAKQSSH